MSIAWNCERCGAGDPRNHLLLPIGEALARFVCEEDFADVRACEGHSCTLMFADRTRRRTRRWCSMAVCGNRAKQAAASGARPAGMKAIGLFQAQRMGTTARHRRRWSRRFDMEDREIRAALDRHWAASDANDFEVEHQIYREDAVLEYPQSGERICGRRNIQASRTARSNRKRFTVRRIIGAGGLWVSESSYTVSIMEFLEGGRQDPVFRRSVRAGAFARAMGRADVLKAGRQYFGAPFDPGLRARNWRARR